MDEIVIISTMNKNYKDLKKLLQRMEVKKALIINQITKKNFKTFNGKIFKSEVISVKDKGLSKSRNLGLLKSKGDICIIADDDMYYEKNYIEIIKSSYNKYSDADIIAFVVDHENFTKRKKILKKKKIGYLYSMKLQSVQITFKKNSIIKNKILFDENFGTGSIYPWGEENIFLFDCLKKGLKIYYVPIKIATLFDNSNSSWDKTNDKKHYKNQGIIFYRMSKKLYLLLIIQFLIRKRKIYNNELNMLQVFRYMISGIIEYKKSMRNNYE